MVESAHDTVQAGSELPLVLLVDDDPDTREMYSVFLKGAGFAVAEAGDAGEALRKAASLLPDVVVTDVGLPGMDGFDLCRRLKGGDRSPSTPVIALTGYSLASAGERAQEASFDAFLLKPCALDDLLAQIRKTIGETRSMRRRAHELRERGAVLRREIRETWARVSETLDRVSRSR